MKTLPEDCTDAISLIEAAGKLENQINDIAEWPGLSGAQRAAALTLVCLQYVNRTEDTIPAHVAAFLAISEERAGKLFDGVEAPPFELISVGGGRPGWAPTQRLEYGD